jgi:hypothetical protein
MADEPREHSAAVEMSTSTTDAPAAPPWMTEATLLLRAWWSRWLLLPLVERVRLVRQRAGKFELLDFALVLLAYQASGTRTIKDFYAQARGGVAGALAGAWGRRELPSRSALSRALRAVSVDTVEALRALFLTCWSTVREASRWVDSSIGRAGGTSSSTRMPPARPSGSVRSLVETIVPPRVVGRRRSRCRDMQDASAARWFARA